uniref:Galactosyltransferase C-terminal domain-containing protein n=1 Tax=Monodelphis domestica TaxID=13616 RepID=A0A5F8G649_MONDO
MQFSCGVQESVSAVYGWWLSGALLAFCVPRLDLKVTRVSSFRRSPAMAGGLFAIERDFFFELGLYDPGLQIWGGENFEISYKIWQCGGKLLFVPCSRVGHIYRLEGWQGNPPPIYLGSSPTLKNYIRVVEVWWDGYKDYFYASRPESKALPYGDISELKKFREDHNCKSFKWFMEEIAYDIISHYPLPPKNVEWGEVRMSYSVVTVCLWVLL